MPKPQLHHLNQDAKRAKLRAVATARKLGGLANDTKWEELIKILHSMTWEVPSYCCKCINSDYVNAPCCDWYAIPFPFSAIEWLDIFYLESLQHGRLLPTETIDHSSEIEASLKRINFDYKKGKKCFRIFGYAPRNEDGFIQI